MTLDESILKEIRELAYKYALLNAIKHNGKARVGPVVSKIIAEKPEIKIIIKQVIPAIRDVVNEVNKLSIEEQEKIIKKNYPELLEIRPKEEKKELPPLPNAIEGRVITRFAPNPDFTIHLGNARAAYLSYIYAEMYKGEMILRFEDTDPRTKTPFPDSYNKVKEDLRWLGIKWKREYIQSLRLPVYYDAARKLIEIGGAYVDKCDADTFRKLRDQGKACPHRDLDPSIHLEEFDKMIEGYYGEGEAVLRIKTDLNYPDPSIREWVALRIIDTSKTPHPVVGDKYVVWPTYNFAAAIDDHLMGVTHIFRGKEHATNTIKQKFLYSHLGWKYPETIHVGRLSLEGVMLSKSKMRKKITEGYEVYDDLRFGTLSALRRRGIVPETIHEIIKNVGINPVDARISYANLAAINRKIIDPRASRYMMVIDPIEITIYNAPEEHKISIIRHPTTKAREEYLLHGPEIHAYISRRDLHMLVSKKMIRLMDLANVEYKGIDYKDGSIVIETTFMDNDLETARKKGLSIIQWVPKNDYILIEILKPEDDKIISEYGYVERAIERIEHGSIIQFYRYGFVRIEKTVKGIQAIYAHP